MKNDGKYSTEPGNLLILIYFSKNSINRKHCLYCFLLDTMTLEEAYLLFLPTFLNLHMTSAKYIRSRFVGAERTFGCCAGCIS